MTAFHFFVVLLTLWIAYSNAFTSPSVSITHFSSPKVGSSPSSSKSTNSLQGSFLEDLFKSNNAAKKITTATRPKVEVPKDFVLPEPKPLTITSKTDLGTFAANTLALLLRLGTSAFVLGWKIDTLFAPKEDANKKYALQLGPLRIRDSSSVLDQAPRPQQPLILYEYDASPFCRRVREMLNLLDLPVEYRPCPGARAGKFSQELAQRTGGRQTVPYLVDPNTGIEMFESNDQINYLLEKYGPPSDMFDKKALWPITWEAFSITTSTWCAIVRQIPAKARQSNARPDNEDMEPLELWGYEGSPFVAIVRTTLCALCLPHVLIPCSRGSANRDKLVAKTGRPFQVPYLVDPNTGIEMLESAEIVEYLQAVYTISADK